MGLRIGRLLLIGLLALGGAAGVYYAQSGQQVAPVAPQRVGTSGILSTVTYHGKRYLLCRVDPQRYRIQAYNQQPDGRGVHTFASLAALAKAQQQTLVFAMNGGMYNQDSRPTGLLVAESQTLHEIQLATTGTGNFYGLPSSPGQHPNGVFGLDDRNRPYIVLSDHYRTVERRTRVATQSGPLLVRNGQLNALFTANSPNLNIRNGVGIDQQGAVLLAISEDEVNFYDFATLFRDQLHCANALYLDGFVSQYYAPELQAAARQTHPLGVFLTVSKRRTRK